MTSNHKVYWITAIVDRGKGEKAASVFKEYQQELLLHVRGHGTASSAIKDCLGLDEPEKDLIIGIIDQSAACALLPALHKKMALDNPGAGIVFTLSLSGISAAASALLTSSEAGSADLLTTEYYKEEHPMSDTNAYELIASVIQADLSNPIMDAARNAGCKGGTLIKARELGSDSTKRLFGLTLSNEKEILLMLVPKKDKQAILKSICETVLKETGEHAIAFSLPVDTVAGINTLMK